MINNVEDLDIVMSMYNLLEYSQNYSMTSRSLWNYYIDKIDNINDNSSDSKSFIYKTKIVGKAPAVPTLNIKVTITFKYLSTFRRFLDLQLINCEMELDLSWKKDCVLIKRNNIKRSKIS